MKISEFTWSEDRIERIARHNVEPEEFEEVCFAKPLVLRAKSKGKNRSTMPWVRRRPDDTCSAW